MISAPVLRPQPSPFPVVFRRVFSRLTPLVTGFTQDGVLFAWFWDGKLDGYLHVRLGAGPQFVVLGRHTHCDVGLARDPGISLRHAVVAAGRIGDELRLRLLDLQSGAGVRTEDGVDCEALVADGALFVMVGGYHLFALPTGSLAPLPWGRDADETWAAIPERVYLDRRLPERGVAPVFSPDTGGSGTRRSIITQLVPPPLPLRQRQPPPGDRGRQVAVLTLGARGEQESYAVHERDVERGLLIGRYERCAFGADDQRLSRVHLLLVRDDQGVWAVDTASSNGTSSQGARGRHWRLHGPTDLRLGNAVDLSWRAG